MECSEFYCVFDRRISRQNTDRKILPDIFCPTALPDRPQPERDRLIKAFSRLRITGERVAAEV
jgi:hypothetical protein